METKKKSYNFGEKASEYYKGQDIPVWRSPKYEQSREAATRLLDSEEYRTILTEADFWIQMNATKSGKMAYTGLIISHDALLRINQHLPEENRFHERYCSRPEPFEYNGHKGMMMEYRDERDGMYEVGEITPENCQNGYSFAMLLKRTFDRVVKRKANLVGIYSDSEAEEFAEKIVDAGAERTVPAATTSKPATQSMQQSTAKPVPAVIPKAEKMTYEAAILHTFEFGNHWKGKTIKELVTSSETESAKRKLLSLYATRGSEKDKAACQVVLENFPTNVTPVEGSTTQAV